MSEYQATSGDTASCCETGEEAFGEGAIPKIDEVEQTARRAQTGPTLRTAILMRGHGPHEAMGGRSRIVLIDQLAAHLQGDDLAAQPAEQPPDGRVIERAFVDGLCRVRCLEANAHAAGTHRLAIRQAIVLEVLMSELEQTGSGVAFIGEDESRGSR